MHWLVAVETKTDFVHRSQVSRELANNSKFYILCDIWVSLGTCFMYITLIVTFTSLLALLPVKWKYLRIMYDILHIRSTQGKSGKVTGTVGEMETI